MEYIKSFEEACELLGHDPKKVLPDLSMYPEKDRNAVGAYCKRIIITDALNRQDNDGKEWFPDWGNTNEYKYEIWFDMAGFSYYGYDHWPTYSACGSRLCFKKWETAKYAAKQFEDVFKMEFLK